MYRRRAGTTASLFLALGLLSSLSPHEALSAPGEEGAAGVPAPAPPSEAPRRISLPEGFHVTLFASEPDVQQPIAVTTDARGRLWVVECYSYPVWKPEGRDRVVIFEDTDHDGRFDRRKVFWDRGANLTGIEIGFGGVWLCATPNLIHIADADSNDVPDGDPVVHLDGWDVKGGHNLFNGLTWGPDGWLYGMNGILSNSRVGPPGTPDSERTPINCGIWRYHPTRRAFEVVAWGTTNPWGLDFDDLGEMFITNCVIPHAFHVIPGAHFERMYGQDFDPHLYGLLESCADHIHWAGGAWQDSRGGKGKHGEAGGGHAHAGAMIYLGDNWPDAYRGSLYTCNIHGNRINRDSLAQSGSGYVARHEKDFFLAGDEWFRGLEMVAGPDGAVFVIDWSDSGECHESDAHGAHHESGRIYKVSYGKTRAVTVDLAALEDRGLVRLQAEKNEWHVRQARRILQERAAAGRDLSAAREELWRMFRSANDAPRMLRGLWALHVTGGVAEEPLLQLLGHTDEHVRVWAVRLACEGKKPSRAALEKIAAMARTDASPRVRLSIASALQRIRLGERGAIARGLAGHAGDSSDANLPLMIWYGIEPLVPLDHEAAASLAEDAAIPTVRRHIARRVVDEPPPGPRDAPGKGSRGLTVLARSLAGKEDSAFRGDVLAGVREALRGRKTVAMPEGWSEVYAKLLLDPDMHVCDEATLLALRFDDRTALERLETTLMDPLAGAARREMALEALSQKRVPGLATRIHRLLADREMLRPALRALAAGEDVATPQMILARYASLDDLERQDAIATLSSRVAYARALLDAVEAKRVPARDLSAFTVRQLQALEDTSLVQRIEKVWGSLRPTSKEKAALMARYKALLSPGRLESADLPRGRLLFEKACGSCHRLYEGGGSAGPDLTGSNRFNTDYVLENVLDPSAAVGNDYKLLTVATTDGRVISGIVRERSGAALVLETATEKIVLSREDIAEETPSDISMMPEGLFEKMTDDEVRDLVGYLRAPMQVPIKD